MMAHTDFFKDKTVLVTGGSGLIGSAFIESLVSAGANVRVVQHRRRILQSDGLDVVKADLRLMQNALQACQGVQVVVHAAGVSGGSKQVTIDPIPMFTESLLMNTHMLEAARLNKVRRFLFISNSSVYAPSNDLLNEAAAWGQSCVGAPENETGMVKRIGEAQCALYARQTEMQIAIMRCANAYGPFDNFDLDASHVVPALIRKAVEGCDPFKVWGDGNTVRDFIHTSDIARAGLFLLADHAVARPVNIATGQTVTIRHLAETIADLAGIDKGRITYASGAPPASAAKRLDIRRMQALGFEPRTGLREGLQQTIAWYRLQGGPKP